MVGIIICTHSTLASGFAAAIEMIMGSQESFEAIGFDPGDDIMNLSERIKELVQRMNVQEAIIFTDLFGASPTNASAIAMVDLNALIITGANLGMVLESLVLRQQDLPLGELSRMIEKAGNEGIRIITRDNIINI